MQNDQHIPYSTRQLVPADVEAYKAMRLEALQKEPGNFGNSYDTEAAFPEETWVARLANPAGACFGLYHENTLIGITAVVVTDKEKPYEAYMTQSYIRKEHRGKGLSQLLYNARISWAKQHSIKSLAIGHRETNIASRRANQHFGFVYSHSEPRTWPDGATENMLYYRLDLD